MKLFLPNLTFEDELTGGRIKPTKATQRAVNELSPLMGLAAEDGDLVAVPTVPKEKDLPECLKHVQFVSSSDLTDVVPHDVTEVVPWGWTHTVKDIFATPGDNWVSAPSHEAVWQVNGRSFNAEHDRVLTDHPDVLPFGAEQFGVLCDSFETWSAAVTQCARAGDNRWVAKPQISHAGRNRVIGTGTELNSQQRGWLAKHLAKPGGVYLEPWVLPQSECGVQFEILDRDAAPTIRLIGVAELLNDGAGRYRGSLISAETTFQTDWDDVIRHGQKVCEAAAELGYRGPLGVDAFRFSLPNGSIATRLCNDLNGRFTMGRLALHLKKWLQPGEFGVWVHFVVPGDGQHFADGLETLATCGIETVRIMRTSPLKIGGDRLRQRTVLLIGQDREDLMVAAKKFQC